jgi:hypothetical protein
MNFEQRKAVGDAHEQRVAEELEKRDWEVSPYGQAVLSPGIRSAISANGYPWRYAPDLIASRDGDVIAVDAKDRMRSTHTDRYAIKKDCVTFGIAFVVITGIPVFYVFGNLGVLTPTEVQAYGTLGPRARGGAYYLVPGRLGHDFDDVFGDGDARGQAA